MKAALTDLFQRFLNSFPSDDDSVLLTEKFQSTDAVLDSKIPIHTVLVKARHADSDIPLAIIVMTAPSLSADDSTILEFAVRRSRAYKVPYFITWTLRSTILWRTPKPSAAVSRDMLEKLRSYEDIYEISPNDDQVLTELSKLTILDRGSDIIFDLKRLLKDEALELVQIDATYFVGRLLDAVHRLLPIIVKSLKYRIDTDISFRDEITSWAIKQSIAGSPTDPEFAKSIARQIIYRLLGKVLFYKSLRRLARHLPKLDLKGMDSSQVLPFIRSAFKKALMIDYQAVFEEDFPDRIKWPADASKELSNLINDFNTRNFDHLPQDVIGTVFERLIPPEERHALGQYFTSENLCDLIVAFCAQSPKDRVLDPTCGTGTFLIRAYDRLRWQGQHNHQKLLSQLWGIDIAPFPSELAVINLFRQRIAEHGNFPRIICKDFFKLSPGDSFPFPPPRMDLDNPEYIEEAIPLFDAIVGNFPYVSAGQIGKHEAGYLEFLNERLKDDWLEDYPKLFFYKNRKTQEQYEQLIALGKQKSCDQKTIQNKISTYADLYVHLFFHAARFLKNGGRLGIVTSNAWLDVNYGYELQNFFLDNFKIIAILESRCEPWFVEASVNTVVTILERCDNPKQRDSNFVRFVKVKRQLSELMPEDPLIEAVKRWKNLNAFVGNIENVGSKNTKKAPLGVATYENKNFRIRVLRQSEIHSELKQGKKYLKLGRYLRAPQIYFDIIGNGKVCLLKDVAIPKFGSKTRINSFYHVSPETTDRFNIEEEYLWPLIKSPKETDTVTVDPSELKLRIFVCHRSKSELKKIKHIGALKYIEWGEKQTYTKGKFKGLPWPEGTWVNKRKPGWWALPKIEIQKSQIYINEVYNERHIQRFSFKPLVADNVLCFLSPHNEAESELIIAILNCSITHLFIELSGRVALGDGALKLQVEDARDYLFIPDLRLASKNRKKRIIQAFEKINDRKIESVFYEVKKSDRIALDSLVFEAIGLDPKDYLKPLYEGLCELVRERISLGQMRSKERKTKVRANRAEKKTIAEVLDDILPQGPKRFPEDFFSSKAAAQSKNKIELPDQPLIFDNSPIFKNVYVKDGNFNHSVKNPAEGKFLIYAQLAGHTTTFIPEETVELTRTVANYEKYLRELRKTFYETYYRRTLDTKTAARLTERAFNYFRLPNP